MSDDNRTFSVPSIHFGVDHIDIDGKKLDLYTLGPNVRIDRSATDSYTVTVTIHADSVTIADEDPEGDNGDFAWMRGQIRAAFCTHCRNDLD